MVFGGGRENSEVLAKLHENWLRNRGKTCSTVAGTLNISCLLTYYIALRRFLHIEAISQQKAARSRDCTLPLFQMTLTVLYSAQYHREHCRVYTPCL